MNNLREAYERIQKSMDDKSIKVTKRQACSLIGLWSWMANTIEMKMEDEFDMRRLFSQIARIPKQWDEAIELSARAVNVIGKAITPTLINAPTKPTVHAPPSPHNEDYAAIIIVDASATGWGAWVSTDKEMFEIRAGWQSANLRSAHAEPMGATEAVKWARTKTQGNVAVVVDHSALALGQRRPGSGNGGATTAYHLNRFFQELYSVPGNHHVFYVKGELNPADRASRANRIGQPLIAQRLSDVAIPPLTAFYHPYANEEDRAWWNV